MRTYAKASLFVGLLYRAWDIKQAILWISVGKTKESRLLAGFS